MEVLTVVQYIGLQTHGLRHGDVNIVQIDKEIFLVFC
jgi:hypothetical protein